MIYALSLCFLNKNVINYKESWSVYRSGYSKQIIGLLQKQIRQNGYQLCEIDLDPNCYLQEMNLNSKQVRIVFFCFVSFARLTFHNS